MMLPASPLLLALLGCGSGPSTPSEPAPKQPTPYELDLPDNWAPMPIPEDNPLTVEGVELGRFLFYDPLLSANNTQSCSSCHIQELAFTDGKRVSEGSTGQKTRRNAMSLVNLGWDEAFFWDGRAGSLEEQALMPIQDPVEMKQDMDELLEELKNHPDYPERFERAFPGQGITPELIGKAIASFERTLISSNNKMDRRDRGEYQFTDDERTAYVLGGTEFGRCIPCHHNQPGESVSDVEYADLAELKPGTFKGFRNHGHPPGDDDQGLGEITGKPEDRGLYKVPTLRNILLTAPYEHGGRLATIDDVLDHYGSGIHDSPDLDPALRAADGKPVRFEVTDEVRRAFRAMAEVLTDEQFLTDPRFSSPFEEAE